MNHLFFELAVTLFVAAIMTIQDLPTGTVTFLFTDIENVRTAWRHLVAARYPAATPDLLALLATDGIKEIHALAANHPHTRTADLQRLQRAGSTPDLMGLSDPDPSMKASEVRNLLNGGIWARQLAVRHPNPVRINIRRLLNFRKQETPCNVIGRFVQVI